MEKEKLERINALARKSRTEEGLTDEERAEQAALREEYILEFRASMTGILENTYIQRENGVKEKLKRNDTKKKS
ncbi:MAG: DUF896 domain-containing protein [Clostridia bacterium]|nr:DUF896 domain-containing protein [Clostridia bacterium]